jgi:FAD/FMN-containing dehydrogenase
MQLGTRGGRHLHATFLVSPERADELERAEEAAQDLFALALSLGGSVSGEHGVGVGVGDRGGPRRLRR